MRLRTMIVAGAFGLAACHGNGDGGDGIFLGSPLPTRVERVFPGLSFTGVTDIQSQPDATGNDRIFVVRKRGTIEFFDPEAATPMAQTYLDVRGIFEFTTDGEQGLLGLAFDPDHAVNGFIYVHLVKESPRRVVIARFHDDGTPPIDPATEVLVLEADEFSALPAFTNHVAGGIAFGPVDGFLYLTMGDGGSSFDPDGAAQDRTDLRGSILRIDVDGTTDSSSATNFDVPVDNPFFGNGSGFREEIFAYGFRNPWRISIERIDAASQRVWVGDVGQGQREEVDIVTAGGNYGWDCREGTLVVAPGNDSAACAALSDADLEAPALEYDHGVGQSITGGYVYRGERLSGALTGRYVYGDFSSGRIWAFDPETGANDLLVDSGLGISTFGTDADGELYIGDFGGGGLYRLAP